MTASAMTRVARWSHLTAPAVVRLGGTGTASFIDLPTYQVAGKTGTANKPRPGGG